MSQVNRANESEVFSEVMTALGEIVSGTRPFDLA